MSVFEVVEKYFKENPNKSTLSQKQVLELVRNAELKKFGEKIDDLEKSELKKAYTVNEIRKYNVILVQTGPMKHYAIVTHIFDKETVLVLTITHSEKFKFKLPLESRQFDGNILTLFYEVPMEIAKNNFICSLIEEKKQIDDIIKFTKNVYKELIFK